MKHPPCSVVAAATAILAVVLAIGGCSTEGDAGKASDTAATASNGDAAMLLKQATDAMRKVTGMHVRLAVTGDVPNLRVTKLEGDISNTPQTVATGSATLLVGNKSEDAKFVYVDGHLYSDLGQPGTYTDFGNGASIYNPRSDHAVVVTGVDTENGIVHLNDSGTPTGRDEQIPMETFVEAWATSHDFMAVTT